MKQSPFSPFSPPLEFSPSLLAVLGELDDVLDSIRPALLLLCSIPGASRIPFIHQLVQILVLVESIFDQIEGLDDE